MVIGEGIKPSDFVTRAYIQVYGRARSTPRRVRTHVQRLRLQNVGETFGPTGSRPAPTLQQRA